MAFCKPTVTPVSEVAAPTVVNGEAGPTIAKPNTVGVKPASAPVAPNSISAIAASTIPDLCDGV